MNLENNVETVGKIKELIEHEQIILQFRRTGYLDRDHALSVYMDFYNKNLDYQAAVAAHVAVQNDGLNVSMGTDEQIVFNLNQQVLFLSEKSLLEGLERKP